MKTWFASLLCGILLGNMIIISVFAKLEVTPGSLGSTEVSLADIAMIMLAAAGLMVTVLGIGVALLAFVGRDQIMRSAEKASVDHVRKEILNSDGLIQSLIQSKIDESMAPLRENGFGPDVNEEDEYGEP
ncbi:hypothetical protein [Emcibacter nanhaiensis]|uniref:Uncharacterized protein n=1 Tax=Emcibacter nanhaiensis TaxID=1505037 RepID=A0A501PBG7_9PROT|nr:hypothetical protein [Emcibacter nanhaiensis]TPD57387.1 hypothetical protein FIV46_14780 [Emcibacter nanhaiensis]